MIGENNSVAPPENGALYKTCNSDETAELLFAIEAALPFVESDVGKKYCSSAGGPAALKSILEKYNWENERWNWGKFKLKTEDELLGAPPEMKTLDVYTDGSSQKDQITSWAFIVVDKGEIFHSEAGVLQGEVCSMYQIGGEMEAVVKSLEWAQKNNFKLNIHHDYNGLSLWVNGSWKAKNKWTQEYVERVNKYKDNLSSFKKVTAHSGNKWNEYVDQIAGSTLKLYCSSRGIKR